MQIHEIKNNNDIGTVIGRYVTLSWKGYKGTGLCPFHDDRHPSLTVDRNKQRFICYACGANGDVINFVEQIENCSFKEALEKLNTKVVIEMKKQRVEKEVSVKKKTPFTKSPVDLNELLPSLMVYATGNSELSGVYLDFEVGVAPFTLPPHFKALAGRIIFPVRDENGILCGYAGRKQLDEGDAPKYMNTTAADGFRRSEILYGMHRAKSSILENGCVYLVEGYKDVLAMHAAGYTNTVGLCGTIMTQKQIELINEYTHKVILMLDGDDAGKAAAIKISGLLEAEGMECFNLILPECSDPDSLFRTIGRTEFRKLIEHFWHAVSGKERLFIGACFYFRDIEINTGEDVFLYSNVLYAGLEAARLLPCSSLNRKFLRYLADDVPMDDFPDDLKAEAELLIEEAFPMYRTLAEDFTEEYKGKSVDVDMEVLTLFHLQYMDDRLRFLIRKIVYQLKHEQDMELRIPLVKFLDLYKKQYEKIADKLDYMGILNMDWRYFRNDK